MNLKELNKLNKEKRILAQLGAYFSNLANNRGLNYSEEQYRKYGYECFELLGTIDNLLGN